MKVWITKYALTEGVFAIDAEPSSSPGWMRYEKGGFHISVSRRHWHEDQNAANLAARAMLDKRVKTLEQQIIKTERFDIRMKDNGAHEAAVLLGTMGGKAGTGAAKRRGNPEYYRLLSRKAVKKRRARARAKEAS